jgi:hypothetical protein
VLTFASQDDVSREPHQVEGSQNLESPIEFIAPAAADEARPEAESQEPDAPLELEILSTQEASSGDLEAAPEPVEVEHLPTAEEAAPVEEQRFEIEDMESFLSPTSTPVVEPEPAAEASSDEPEFSAWVFDSKHDEPVAADEPTAEPPVAEAAAPDVDEGFIEPMAADWNAAAVLDSDAAAAPTMSFEPVDSDPAAAPETPHATFAEHGFEGSAASTDSSVWRTPNAPVDDSDPAAAADLIDEPGFEASYPEAADEEAGFEPATEAPEQQPAAEVMHDETIAESAAEAPMASPPSVRSDPDDWFTIDAKEQPPAGSGEPPPSDEWIAAEAHPSQPEASDDWFSEPATPEPVVSGSHPAEDLYLAPELVHVPQASDDVAPPQAGDEAEPVAAEAAEQVAATEPVETSAEVPDESAGQQVAAEAALPATDVPHARLGYTPRFTAAMAPDAPAPPPFVTETLAELYIKQGFHNEALAIYRQLAERDPHDDAIRRRIEALEVGETAKVVQRADDEGTTDVQARSQSVRTFFAGFARRTPSASAVEARLARNADEAARDASAAPPDGRQAESSFAAAASALATLFAASNPAAGDEGAASRLAGAYTEPAPGGRPSRAADRELSLDHLFRDVPASGTGGVMLDQFYTPPVDSSGQAARPDEGAGTPDEGEADIRQFTAWLEGLRKK